MAGAFWGGLSQGLAHGVNQGMELQLKKKMIDAQIKHLDAQTGLQNLQLERHKQNDQLLNDYQAMTTGGTPKIPGYEDQSRQMSVAEVPAKMGNKPLAPADILKMSAARAGHYPASMFPASQTDLEQQLQTMIKYGLIKPPPETAPAISQSNNVGPTTSLSESGITPAIPQTTAPVAAPSSNNQIGFTVSPRGMTVRSNPEPIPRGANSRIFVDYQKEQRALGKSDEQIRTGWNEYLRNQSESRATGGYDAKGNPINQAAQQGINRAGSTGSALGTLDVQSSAPYQQTQQDIAAKRALGGEQAKASSQLVGMSGTVTLVNKIADLANKLPAGEGWNRFLEGGKLKLGALAQSDPDAAQLEQLRESYSNILNRSLLAEKGVLTDQDRKFATDAIPSLFDTKEMRQRKVVMFKTLNNLLLNGEQALATGKFDPQAFRKTMNSLSGTLNSQGQSTGPKTAEEYLKSLQQ